MARSRSAAPADRHPFVGHAGRFDRGSPPRASLQHRCAGRRKPGCRARRPPDASTVFGAPPVKIPKGASAGWRAASTASSGGPGAPKRPRRGARRRARRGRRSRSGGAAERPDSFIRPWRGTDDAVDLPQYLLEEDRARAWRERARRSSSRSSTFTLAMRTFPEGLLGELLEGRGACLGPPVASYEKSTSTSMGPAMLVSKGVARAFPSGSTHVLSLWRGRSGGPGFDRATLARLRGTAAALGSRAAPAAPEAPGRSRGLSCAAPQGTARRRARGGVAGEVKRSQQVTAALTERLARCRGRGPGGASAAYSARSRQTPARVGWAAAAPRRSFSRARGGLFRAQGGDLSERELGEVGEGRGSGGRGPAAPPAPAPPVRALRSAAGRRADRPARRAAPPRVSTRRGSDSASRLEPDRLAGAPPVDALAGAAGDRVGQPGAGAAGSSHWSKAR